MLNQNPRQADFVLGTCPNCQKVVRIPVTAVTSQSKSQVKCPICSSEFEIADVLEEMIPSVEIVDDGPQTVNDAKTSVSSQPEKINAIDTPELFHVSKDNYQPKTEKKNGRFVVPDLLSKGIKKKRKRSRRGSRKSPEEKKLVEASLAKLKANTSSPTLASQQKPKSERKSGDRSRSRSGRSKLHEGDRQGTRRKSTSRAGDKIRSDENVLGIPDMSVLGRNFSTVLTRLTSGFSKAGTKAEYLMIGFGALIAIPILHLVMWWFIGIDPIGLARPTQAIIPFVVPKSMHVKAGNPETATPLLMRPANEGVQSSTSDADSADGKLPRPELDPRSVHAD